MARTELVPTQLAPNGAVPAGAGTPGTTDGHFIVGKNKPEELVLEVTIATAPTVVRVRSGAYPPSLAAGQGDAEFTLAVGSHRLGPFESGRFTQADGSLWLNYGTPANVNIAARRVPRGV